MIGRRTVEGPTVSELPEIPRGSLAHRLAEVIADKDSLQRRLDSTIRHRDVLAGELAELRKSSVDMLAAAPLLDAESGRLEVRSLPSLPDAVYRETDAPVGPLIYDELRREYAGYES